MRSSIEEMKSIPICDLFYHVALNIVGPLPEITNGNKYVLVAINHYFKWCEARPIKKHDAHTIVKFLEDEIICKYRVLQYILTNNGNEWMMEFAKICQNYGIKHQFITPAWPQCNGMVECLIKTIKHGLTIMATINIHDWDFLLPRILFGY
jgi:hypothetical protein